ncbi:unnamed protein product [Ambrosiozyma monospora]|uniref:Unnamed protein product n=1 Tax=Ambrosiozyma monospora TaxID=43982 RepID=A0ACB5U558_AMBMO|nr:unnamed protein product [Ambrosiozyma monospora]
MGYNRIISLRCQRTYSGASYPLETGSIDYASNGKRFHCGIRAVEFGGKNVSENPHLVVQMKSPKYIRKLMEDDHAEQVKIKRECVGSQVFFNTEFAILSDFFNFVFLKFTLPSNQETNNTRRRRPTLKQQKNI